MKRIDSVNARPDVNGTGKTGFHDNADKNGQDATYLTPNWCNAVQEELCNAIEGFGQTINDPSNNAQLFTILYALSGRIGLLENKVNEDIAVGSVFITTIQFEDSNAVRAHKLYGRWQRLGDGHALVARAQAGNTLAPSWMFDIGGTGGEYRHLQTLAELVKHKHSKAPYDKFGAIAAESGTNTTDGSDRDNIWSEYGIAHLSDADWELAVEQNVGGGQPFNIVQPSLVVDVWLRLPDQPVELEPTYELTANRTSMHVGETVIFTLNTTNLEIGAAVRWRLVGVDAADVSPSNLFGSFLINAAGRATYAVKALSEGEFTLSLIDVPNQFISITVAPNDQTESPYDQYPIAEWFYQSNDQYIALRDDTTIESPETHITDYHRKQTSLFSTEVFVCVHVIKEGGEDTIEATYQIPVVTDHNGLVVTQLVNNIGDTSLETGEAMSIYVGYFAEEQDVQTPMQADDTLGGVIHEFHFH